MPFKAKGFFFSPKPRDYFEMSSDGHFEKIRAD